MAKEYLEKLTKLFEQVDPEIIDDSNYEIKHFFSGAAVYAEGKICISLSPVGFAIKLPEVLRIELLKENGAKPLRYFAKSPVKKEYVVLPKSMVDDKKLLSQLIKKSFEYVNSLKE